MSGLVNDLDPGAVARELVNRFGAQAEAARKQLCRVARERHRPDALLTLMQAQAWVELMLRTGAR